MWLFRDIFSISHALAFRQIFHDRTAYPARQNGSLYPAHSITIRYNNNTILKLDSIFENQDVDGHNAQRKPTKHQHVQSATK